MFRALEHEGVATDCLVELFVGDRRMSIERRIKVIAACAVLANTMRVVRGQQAG